MGGYRNVPGDDCNRRRGNDSGVRRQVRLPAQLACTHAAANLSIAQRQTAIRRTIFIRDVDQEVHLLCSSQQAFG